MTGHDGLQVLIAPSPAGLLPAGVPSGLRLAHAAHRELSPSRLVLCEEAAFGRKWKTQLRGLGPEALAGAQPASAVLEPERPLLVLSAAGFAREGSLGPALERLAREANGRPSRWQAGAQAAAAYFPRAGQAFAGTVRDTARLALEHRDAAALDLSGWLPAFNAETAGRAEAELCRRLAKDTDGYIARLDRRVSIALSRLLLPLPVTPNAITTASLALGLLGAWGLASASYAGSFAGALLLWFCCILDGCDGEVARLKLLSSPSGASYDLTADHLAHLATFVAIPIGVHRRHPDAAFLWPGALLVSGFLVSTISIWWLILRRPEESRGRFPLVIERVASRDYVYLILILAAVGRMDWFLWAAGIGSHLFYLTLWLLAA